MKYYLGELLLFLLGAVIYLLIFGVIQLLGSMILK